MKGARWQLLRIGPECVLSLSSPVAPLHFGDAATDHITHTVMGIICATPSPAKGYA